MCAHKKKVKGNTTNPLNKTNHMSTTTSSSSRRRRKKPQMFKRSVSSCVSSVPLLGHLICSSLMGSTSKGAQFIQLILHSHPLQPPKKGLPECLVRRAPAKNNLDLLGDRVTKKPPPPRPVLCSDLYPCEAPITLRWNILSGPTSAYPALRLARLFPSPALALLWPHRP